MDEPAPSLSEQFEVKRRLGVGGIGVVYEAFDRERGVRVALKTLQFLDPERLYRLKREFRALADLEHPNLVRLGEFRREGEHWFFTMELVEGRDLLSYVRSGSTTGYDEARIRSSFSQLAAGLDALHAAGKVHRDVKPSNVLVEKKGRVVIVDFGLAYEGTEDEEPLPAGSVVGSARYMAPEQARGDRPGPAADMYALGVVMFEALTGQVPFEGEPLEILAAKDLADAPRVKQLNSLCPAELDQLVAELLSRDPAARPSAQAVQARLGGPATRESRLDTAIEQQVFVGRQAPLAELARGFADSRGGRSVFVLIEGESGIGKTTLARRALHHLRDTRGTDRPWILEGRCYEGESLPYKLFDGIVDALGRRLGRLSDPEVAALLPADVSLLLRVFPALQRSAVVRRKVKPSREQLSPHILRARAFAALRELLARVADARPLVLFVDDLQWVDADSLNILSEVFPDPTHPAVLFVATARPGHGLALPPAPGLVDARRIALGPLAPEEAEQLATLDGAGDVAFARRIAAEAGGHPMFIQELARHSTATGRTSALEETLWERIQDLAPGERRLLDVVAIAGSPIRRDVAARAADLDLGAEQRAVSALRMGRLVRTSGPSVDDRIEPYHDRVREAVGARTDAAVQRDIHARLARAYAVDDDSVASQLARVMHLAAAGEASAAAALGVVAAGRAMEALAFQYAAELYRTVIRLRGIGDADPAPELRLPLAEALTSAGRGVEAAREFLCAAGGVSGDARLDCQRRAAQQLLTSGHVEEGLAAFSDVLAQVGERVPETQRTALAAMLWLWLKLRVRRYRFTPRPPATIAPAELNRIDVCRSAAIGLSMTDNIRGGYLMSRGLLRAMNVGDARRVGLLLAFHALWVGGPGLTAEARSLALLERARALAVEVDDPYLTAWVHFAEGVVPYWMGRFETALTAFDGSEEELRQLTTGTAWEQNTLRLLRLATLRLLGRYGEVTRLGEGYLRDATQRGDRYAVTSFSLAAVAAWLAAGQRPRVVETVTKPDWVPPSSGFHVQHFLLLRSRVELALYDGDQAAARDCLPGFRALDGSMLTRSSQLVRSEATWVRGRAALLLGAPRREVRRFAARLRDERAGYATAWGLMLDAAADAEESREKGLESYRTAARAAAEARLHACAAACRHWAGRLTGGRLGDDEQATAIEDLRALGVSQSREMLQVLAPGKV